MHEADFSFHSSPTKEAKKNKPWKDFFQKYQGIPVADTIDVFNVSTENFLPSSEIINKKVTYLCRPKKVKIKKFRKRRFKSTNHQNSLKKKCDIPKVCYYKDTVDSQAQPEEKQDRSSSTLPKTPSSDSTNFPQEKYAGYPQVYKKHINSVNTHNIDNFVSDFSDCTTDSYNDSFFSDYDILKIFIEKELHSSLKEIYTKRCEAKILESEGYAFWHKRTKDEMRKLSKFVPKNQVAFYLQKCFSEMDERTSNSMSKNKSIHSLSVYLHERENVRHNSNKYFLINETIMHIWKKLKLEYRIDDLILLARTIQSEYNF